MAKKIITSKPLKVSKHKKEELISDLDDLFGIDEVVDIDAIIELEHSLEQQQQQQDIIEPITDSMGTTDNLPKQSHKEDFVLSDDMHWKFAMHLMKEHQVIDKPLEFYEKFRYYCIKENVPLSQMTYRRMMKFLRTYNEFSMDDVRQTLNQF